MNIMIGSQDLIGVRRPVQTFDELSSYLCNMYPLNNTGCHSAVT